MKEQVGLDGLTGLVAFARAATLGSFTAAARALAVSPSAVSKSVQRLELRLGVSLLTRTTRSLQLTPEGREVHERALRLLREVEDLQQAAQFARKEPAGTLRVTTALPIGARLLAPALPRFQQRFPKLQVELRLSDEFLDLTREGIDVAIRVGNLADSRLSSRRLGPHRVCAFASPVYLAAQGTPRSLDDLAKHRCVGLRFASTGQVLRWPFQVGRRQVEVAPTSWALVDYTEAVVALLIAGAGIGMLPSYVAAAHVARRELVPVLARHAVDRHTFTALWPANRRGNPNVRAFLKFLEEVFPSPPPWDACLEARSV
jgi:DNA-binding transcriptional LysR family regulator